MKVVPAIAKNKKSRIRSIAKHCTTALHHAWKNKWTSDTQKTGDTKKTSDAKKTNGTQKIT